jgi:multiple antibiotic resistance protein
MDWDIAIKEFITLWVVIDPIGTIPVFLAVTAGLSTTQQRSIAMKSTLIAGLILLFFIVGGQMLMEGLNIRLEAFQIAGGIILFLFATTMIFGDGKPATEQKQFDGNISHLAVFPLAMPSLASPGAMLSVVMLTDNHRYS